MSVHPKQSVISDYTDKLNEREKDNLNFKIGELTLKKLIADKMLELFYNQQFVKEIESCYLVHIQKMNHTPACFYALLDAMREYKLDDVFFEYPEQSISKHVNWVQTHLTYFSKNTVE